MISDYTEQQHSDMLHRDRAGARANALLTYQLNMQMAVRASLVHGDERSADGLRADARAALHMYPELLAMVEPPPVERSYGEGQMWYDAQRSADEPILSLVERIGEWTGR